MLLGAVSATARPLDDRLLHRLARLQAIFVSVVLYFVLVRHLANLYVAEHVAVERFLLIDGGGGVYPAVFWGGQILAGSIAPLVILWGGGRMRSRGWIGTAAGLVVVGGFSQLYGIIIGGQAAPLLIFPGKEVIEGALIDGEPSRYLASAPELLLGLGGVAVSLLILVLAIRVAEDPPGAVRRGGRCRRRPAGITGMSGALNAVLNVAPSCP